MKIIVSVKRLRPDVYRILRVGDFIHIPASNNWWVRVPYSECENIEQVKHFNEPYYFNKFNK